MNRNPKLYIAYDPVYAHPLPEGHRFPMAKYQLIPEQLLYEGTISKDHLFSPAVCPADIVLLTPHWIPPIAPADAKRAAYCTGHY